MQFYGNFTEENRQKFMEVLQTLGAIFGRIYADDNLIALSKSAGFLQDAKFSNAFNAYAKTNQEQSLAWRLHTLCWAAKRALKVEGDFVECGVFKGFSFAVVLHYLEFAQFDKRCFLYDTFEGIPAEYNLKNDQQRMFIEAKDTAYDEVCDKFTPYGNVQIIKGVVPDSFTGTLPEKIAFCHIDMNSARSELEALQQIYPRMSKGGIIIFDDYGWFAYRAQKEAEDDYLNARGAEVLELPTGQGMVLCQ